MDTQSLAGLLKDTATKVINPRFRELARADVEEKEPGDLVTIADRESEKHLTKLLHEVYPDAVVVGEEGVFLGKSLLETLAGAEHAFVIDPIDGTRNFVNGKVEHGVMLAELRRGETTRGWIWQPQVERLYTVERGAGDVLLNGESMPRGQQHDPPLGATGQRRRVGYTADGALQPTVKSSGAACFDYPAVVSGEIDFMAFSNAHAWDHLAGALMLKETGGLARMIDGEDYNVRIRRRGLLVARTPEIWGLARDVWQP